MSELLGRFSHHPTNDNQGDEPDIDHDSGKPIYTSSEFGQPQLTISFVLNDADESYYNFSYSLYKGMIFTQGRYLTIDFVNMIVHLSGDGLARIYRALSEHRVKSIHCYNEARFALPPETDKDHTIIYEMTIQPRDEFLNDQ